MTRIAIAWTAIAVALGLSACGAREHLRQDFGKRTNAYFDKQRVRTDAAPGGPAGLDSEEAGIVYATYRKQLGKQAEGTKDAPAKVLILEESKSEKKKP